MRNEPGPTEAGAWLAGGLAMGAGGPILMRRLRRIMLGNRAGAPR